MRFFALTFLVLAACGASSTRDAGVDAGPTCPLLGKWEGTYGCPTLGGWPVNWVFSDDAGAVLSQGWPPMDQVPQAFTFGAHQLQFTELSNPDCTTSASYQVAFEPNCDSLTLSMKSDACAVRAQCLDGLALTRP